MFLFIFSSFKKFSRSVLQPVPIKNISSINLWYISENVLINEYLDFLSNWFIKMCAYEGTHIVPMAQSYLQVVFAIENKVGYSS